MFNPERYDGRMPYRRCGKWGLKLPAITLGCWHNFGGGDVTENQRRMITAAFDCGITHFDLANNYGPPFGSAELNCGKILRELPRHEILVSTKAGYIMWPGPYGEWGSRKYLLNSLDQSLERLGMDYVDIFYSHRPDPNTPLEETLGALDHAVRSGKALYAAISSYNSALTREAVQIVRENRWAPIILHQPNYSLLNRWIDGSLKGTCRELGLGIIAFCPLYQGLLTDRYLNGVPSGSRATVPNSLLRSGDLRPEVIEMVRELAAHAKERGQTLAQMALAWVLRDDSVTSALIGASSAEQIRENVVAVRNTTFTADELAKLDAIVKKVELPENPWPRE